MKKIILLVVGTVCAMPVLSQAYQKNKNATHIKYDHGSYSEHQMDYKKSWSDYLDSKTRGGYYNGAYHNQSPTFRPNDEQFIPAGKNARGKHYRHHKNNK